MKEALNKIQPKDLFTLLALVACFCLTLYSGTQNFITDVEENNKTLTNSQTTTPLKIFSFLWLAGGIYSIVLIYRFGRRVKWKRDTCVKKKEQTPKAKGYNLFK